MALNFQKRFFFWAMVGLSMVLSAAAAEDGEQSWLDAATDIGYKAAFGAAETPEEKSWWQDLSPLMIACIIIAGCLALGVFSLGICAVVYMCCGPDNSAPPQKQQVQQSPYAGGYAMQPYAMQQQGGYGFGRPQYQLPY